MTLPSPPRGLTRPRPFCARTARTSCRAADLLSVTSTRNAAKSRRRLGRRVISKPIAARSMRPGKLTFLAACDVRWRPLRRKRARARHCCAGCKQALRPRWRLPGSSCAVSRLSSPSLTTSVKASATAWKWSNVSSAPVLPTSLIVCAPRRCYAMSKRSHQSLNAAARSPATPWRSCWGNRRRRSGLPLPLPQVKRWRCEASG
ncbi:hypothetical protein D3C78_1033470 [compost metagenome]